MSILHKWLEEITWSRRLINDFANFYIELYLFRARARGRAI